MRKKTLSIIIYLSFLLSLFSSCGNKAENINITVSNEVSEKGEKLSLNSESTESFKSNTDEVKYTESKVQKIDSKKVKNIYKEYFNKNYKNNEKVNVYIADVTHDGQDDMLVSYLSNFFFTFHVYTIVGNKAQLIYEGGFHNNRQCVFLTSDKGSCNIVSFYTGICTGAGSNVCEEYYITNSGEKKEINSFELYYDYRKEDFEIYKNKWSAMVEKNYGKNYSKLYQFDVTEYSMSDFKISCKKLPNSPKEVFGDNNEITNLITTVNNSVDLKSILVKGAWAMFSWQSISHHRIIFHNDGTYDLYDVNTYYSCKYNNYMYSGKYKVEGNEVYIFGAQEFPLNVFSHATYSETEDYLISDWIYNCEGEIDDYGNKSSSYYYSKYAMIHFPEGMNDDYNYSEYSERCCLLYDYKDA